MKKTILMLALAVAAASPASAQGWTLQQCLEHAAQHNIQVQKNRIAEEESKQSLLQAQAALFPSLSFSMSQSLGYRPFQEATVMVQNGMATTTNNKVTESGSYGINANWNVWDGGINRKTIDAQRVQKDMAEMQTAQSLNSIQEQIAQLYVQILYTIEAKKVNERLCETAQSQYNRGLERLKVGDIAKADVAQLESQLASAKYDVVNSQTQIDGYKRQLKSLLQLDINTPFDVAENELADERAMAPIPAKDEVYKQAVAHRPEIRTAQLAMEAADIQNDIARRGYYPSIGVNAGFGDSHYSASNDSYGEQLKRNLSGSLGLSVSVPIFDNRRNKTNVEKAKLQKVNAALELDNQLTTLGSNIENYWLQATSAQQRFIAAQTTVKSQQTSYELVNEQFKEGLKNIVDLLQARDNMLNAQQNMLQSKYTTILNTQMLRFYADGTMGL
ncbi:MAG: TolC family protein [Bacteroidaceae bacterium]|nr:TolC family protein [Bacteroidaceae bacterium]